MSLTRAREIVRLETNTPVDLPATQGNDLDSLWHGLILLGRLKGTGPTTKELKALSEALFVVHRNLRSQLT